MRILLFLLAVVPLSAMAIDIYLERQREAREATFVTLAGEIVTEALDAPARQRVIGAVVTAPEDNGGLWGLRGKLFLADESGDKAHRRIGANFEKTCADIERADCWQLASLTVDGALVLPTTGPDGASEIAAAEPSPAATPEQSAESLPQEPPASVETSAAAPTDRDTLAAAPAPQEPPAETTAAVATPLEEPAVPETVTETPLEDPSETPAADSETPAADEEQIAMAPAPEPAPAPRSVAPVPAATIDLTKTVMEPATEAPEQSAESPETAPASPDPAVQSVAVTAAVQAALNELGYNQSVPLKVDGKMGPRTRVAIRDYQKDHGLALDAAPSRDLLTHMRTQIEKRGAVAQSTASTAPSVPEIPAAPLSTEDPLPRIASTSDPGPDLPAAPELPALEDSNLSTGAASIASRSQTTEPTAVQSASVTGTTAPAPEVQTPGLTYLIQDRLVKLGYDEAEPLKLDGKFGARTRALIAAYMRDHNLGGDAVPSRDLLRHMEESLRQARLRGNVGSQR